MARTYPRLPAASEYIATISLLAVAWLYVLVRTLPDRSHDRGIFVSVGEKLLHGEVLYSTIYDNKEPLFFYFVAFQRFLGNFSEWGAEVALIVLCSISSYVIVRTRSDARSARILAFIAVPVIITGEFYYPGYTHLPATAATLAMLAAILTGYFSIAGGLFSLATFLKIPAAPVALAIAAVAMALRARTSHLIAFIAAGAILSAAIVAVMAQRGELFPFLNVIAANFQYAQGGLVRSVGVISGAAAHIARVESTAFYVAIVCGAASLSLASLSLPRIASVRSPKFELIAVGTAALTAGLAVLLLTGLWPHHNQILYIGASIGALSLGTLVEKSMRKAPLLSLFAVACLAYLLAGAPNPRLYVSSFVDVAKRYSSLYSLSPETALLLSINSSGTYARIGQNDDHGHATGLDRWQLSCPRFHQYPFDPPKVLDAVFSCASRTPTLLIGSRFGASKLHADRPAWTSFVARVHDLLATQYSCSSDTGARVCVRNAAEK